MTRTIRWTFIALSELDDGIRYIARRDEAAARAVRARVEDAVERLARHPTGRPSRVAEHSETPVARTHLTLCYRATPDTLTIVRCIHQSRDWPKDRWPRD
jgi:plasmid stabilization system protein ParE